MASASDDDDGGGHLPAACIRIHAEELAGFRRSHLFIESDECFFLFLYSLIASTFYLHNFFRASKMRDEARLASIPFIRNRPTIVDEICETTAGKKKTRKEENSG